MKQRGIDTSATIALIVAMLCWSSVPLVLKHLTAFLPDGFTTNAVRYPLAALMYLPWLIMALRDPAIRRLWPWALLPTLPNIFGQTCWAWAPYYIDPGLMSFVARTSVIWAIVIATIYFPTERLLLKSKRFWTGMALSVSGFVTIAIFSGALHAQHTMKGIIITAFSGLFGGLYVVGVRAAVGSMNPMTTFAFVSMFTAAGCVLIAPLGEPSSLLTASKTGIAYLVVSSFIGLSLAHGLYYFAIQRLGAMICASTATLTPFVTGVASVIIFHEHLRPAVWLGGTVLVIGTAMVIWSQEHMRPSESEQ